MGTIFAYLVILPCQPSIWAAVCTLDSQPCPGQSAWVICSLKTRSTMYAPPHAGPATANMAGSQVLRKWQQVRQVWRVSGVANFSRTCWFSLTFGWMVNGQQGAVAQFSPDTLLLTISGEYNTCEVRLHTWVCPKGIQLQSTGFNVFCLRKLQMDVLMLGLGSCCNEQHDE